MKIINSSIILICTILLTSTYSLAIDITKEQVVTKLQQNYDEMQSLSFDFFQRSGGELTGRVKTGQGNCKLLKIEKTNLMRWDYLQPEIQVLFSDGDLFSMYFENSNQMIITPASALETDITYGIFTGKTTLANDFEISEADDSFSTENIEQDIVSVLRLVPKESQSQIQNIHIWVSSDSLIKRIQIRDHFGSITTLVLTNILVNNIDNNSDSLNLFDFSPPEGTEIIRQ
ncbi:MAG: outer membrane lipoprotein carrier protein LolA [Desulfotalea sp.]